MLKKGMKFIANWDSSIVEVINIKNDVVIYKCFNYANTNSKDGFFRDSKKDFAKCFTKLEE